MRRDILLVNDPSARVAVQVQKANPHVAFGKRFVDRGISRSVTEILCSAFMGIKLQAPEGQVSASLQTVEASVRSLHDLDINIDGLPGFHDLVRFSRRPEIIV